MALEGCETVNAAKTVSGQYAPVLLTRMANWIQAGSVSSSWDQDWPFSTDKTNLVRLQFRSNE